MYGSKKEDRQHSAKEIKEIAAGLTEKDFSVDFLADARRFAEEISDDPLWTETRDSFDLGDLNMRPIFVVEDAETIVFATYKARIEFGIKTGKFREQVKLLGGIDSKDQRFRRAEIFSENTQVVDLVSISLPLKGGNSRREAFAIFSKRNNINTVIIKEKYLLTNSESEVLRKFSDGKSIEEIARLRCRSVGTVRTQFYRIMEKLECRSQLELLRKIQYYSSNEAAYMDSASAFSITKRTSFQLMGEDGRVVDVIRAGHPQGRALISCNTHLSRCLPSWLEDLLEKEEICLFYVSPPGQGSTTAPENWNRMAELFAQDVNALLTTTGHQSAVLFATATSMPICLKAARILGQKIESICGNTAIAPLSRRNRSFERSFWIENMKKFSLPFSPNLMEIALYGMIKYIMFKGLANYIEKSLQHDTLGKELALRRENFVEVARAFESSLLHGPKATVELLKMCLVEDWEDDLQCVDIKVHLALGRNDSVGPFKQLEKLAEDYPKKIDLTVVENASSVFLYYNPCEFINLINRAFDKRSPVGW